MPNLKLLTKIERECLHILAKCFRDWPQKNGAAYVEVEAQYLADEMPEKPSLNECDRMLRLMSDYGACGLILMRDNHYLATVLSAVEILDRELLVLESQEEDEKVAHKVGSRQVPITLFYSYAHADEEFKVLLDKHLASLKRESSVRSWHDRMIDAGEKWEVEIRSHLDASDVILLLISADFLASSYCFDIEMTHAIERHNRGDACVIPIIVRPCEWHNTPFAMLQALPKDGRAVTSWTDRDDAYTDIARGIRKAVLKLLRQRQNPKVDDSECLNRAANRYADTLVATDNAHIELTIDREFESYSEEDKQHLLDAIGNLLETDTELRVIRRRRGSVKLTIELSHENAERLLWAIRQGSLQAHGVIDANLVEDHRHVPNSHHLQDKLEMSTAEIGLSVRTINCLEERGIFTVHDLLQSTREDLLTISNFGEKMLDEVYTALESIGFYRRGPQGPSNTSP